MTSNTRKEPILSLVIASLKKDKNILRTGHTNLNFHVFLKDKEFHLKVRRHKSFPSFSKLRLVNELLQIHGIPYTPIVDSIDFHTEFPNGAILFEWKNGETIQTLEKYQELLPAILEELRAVHSTHVPYYENIDLGIQAKLYSDFITKILLTRSAQCRQDKLINAEMHACLSDLITSIHCGTTEVPVLVHRDLTKSNVLIQPDGSILFIDWDNTEFTTPLADIARIIFAYQWVFTDHVSEKIITFYLKGSINSEQRKVLELEYVRNALDGLFFGDADPSYCHMVIRSILQKSIC